MDNASRLGERGIIENGLQATHKKVVSGCPESRRVLALFAGLMEVVSFGLACSLTYSLT